MTHTCITINPIIVLLVATIPFCAAMLLAEFISRCAFGHAWCGGTHEDWMPENHTRFCKRCGKTDVAKDAI